MKYLVLVPFPKHDTLDHEGKVDHTLPVPTSWSRGHLLTPDRIAPAGEEQAAAVQQLVADGFLTRRATYIGGVHVNPLHHD